MIYIETAEQGGRGIYLDIHAAERDGRGVRLSGMVGDGFYEGEVLIEVGREVEVTFVDSWLGGGEVNAFLERCGADRLRLALAEAGRSLPLAATLSLRGAGGAPSPHVHLPLFDGGGRVAEEGCRWAKSA